MTSASAGRAPQNNLLGVLCAIGGALCFSVNDMAIKFLSGDYALHQVVLMRAAIAMIVTLALIVPLSGGLACLRTRRPGVHLIRGGCVVLANMCFFLALAAMPLADATAIFFVSPLLITAASVLVLGEAVGPRRWLAVGLGLAGVIVMMRPGTGAFQMAALLPVAAASAYAALHIMTRWMGATERAVTMSFYIQLTFIAVSTAMGLTVGDGRFADTGDASLDFLLRAWVWPDPADAALLILVGLASAGGGFLISQAYRVAEAGLAAPFEYVAMPLAIFWGVVIFGDWPDAVAWVGIALIISGGLYLFWREAAASRRPVAGRPPAMR
jgi:drug/metabolite transporter (DMT)-like permease